MEILKKGSRGENVKLIQRKLNLYPDGIYGVLTEEAVKSFQCSKGLKVDGIVGPATFAMLSKVAVDDTYGTSLIALSIQLKSTRRAVSRLIVHCSATAEGKDYTVADITRWHKAQGWSTIGYHYVIYRDGSLHEGRDVNLIGAHTSGYNTGSIGICYIGGVDADGKPKDTRTEAQKQTLRTLLSQLRKMYTQAKIYGHRNFTNAKACPSFDAKTEYENL